MEAKQVIRNALDSTMFILQTYLSDLTDEELLIQPGEGANLPAWQLGHLILSEDRLLAEFPGYKPVEWPAGFAERHSRGQTASTERTGWASKAQYLELYGQVRANTLAVLDGLSNEDLDTPSKGAMAKFAPTYAAVLILASNHTLMHGGQLAVLRRKLGKAVLI